MNVISVDTAGTSGLALFDTEDQTIEGWTHTGQPMELYIEISELLPDIAVYESIHGLSQNVTAKLNQRFGLVSNLIHENHSIPQYIVPNASYHSAFKPSKLKGEKKKDALQRMVCSLLGVDNVDNNITDAIAQGAYAVNKLGLTDLSPVEIIKRYRFTLRNNIVESQPFYIDTPKLTKGYKA